MSVKNAKNNNIKVGICGELARNEELLPFFLKIGVDELSVSPPYVLILRNLIAHINTNDVNIGDYLS